MKRILALILLLATVSALALAGCKPTADTGDGTLNGDDAGDGQNVVTRIGYFPGTTGLGMAKMIADADAAYSFSKYQDQSAIMTAIQQGVVDIAAFPTNAVPQLYSNATNGGVRMLAINTLGVLHILTNGVEIHTLSDLAGKDVYYPAEAPRLVLDYILKANGIEVNYKPSTLDALPMAIATGGEVQIALLPEPKATVAAVNAKKAGNTVTFALDLTEEWNRIDPTKPLVQGCVVVTSAFAEAHPEAVDEFLKKYEKSIEYMADSANLDSAAQMAVDAGILPAVPVAKQAIPRSHIAFIAGEDMRAAATAFITAVGGSVPAGDFFYLSANQ